MVEITDLSFLVEFYLNSHKKQDTEQNSSEILYV